MDYFSQGDEDRFMAAVLSRIETTNFYVDIGASDPTHYSNTYHFYQRGWHGLCVDPEPRSKPQFAKVRPRDRFEAVACADFDGSADFYFGHHSVHNSLIRSDERHRGHRQVPVRRLAGLLDEMDAPKVFDILSIDAEGAEQAVLKGLDLSRYRPRLICCEFNTARTLDMELQPYLISQGYHVLMVTCWNLIVTSDFATDYRVFCKTP